jgi:hypothetical protein
VKPTAANDADAFTVPSDQNAETAAIDYGPRPTGPAPMIPHP